MKRTFPLFNLAGTVKVLVLAAVLSTFALGALPGRAAAAACSPSDTSACTSKNCASAGGTWENPFPGTTHPETCVFSENTNSGGKFAQAARSCSAKPRFLGLVPWYEYLTLTDDFQGGCKITQFQSGNVLGADEGKVKTASPFLLIGLAILQDLVRIAALVAVGFVIFGGFKYIMSQGAPEDTKEAQKTIINALIGLTFAILAAGIVGFIGNKLG